MRSSLESASLLISDTSRHPSVMTRIISRSGLHKEPQTPLKGLAGLERLPAANVHCNVCSCDESTVSNAIIKHLGILQ